MKTKNDFKLEIITYSLLGISLFFSILVSTSKEVQSSIRKIFSIDGSRQVLSSIESDVLHNQGPAKIIKVKEKGRLALEIYLQSEQNPYDWQMIKKFDLGEVKDSFFNSTGSTANLILNDVDGDRQPEIVVPTSDDSLVARLNVFKYDSTSNEFYEVDSSTAFETINVKDQNL